MQLISKAFCQPAAEEGGKENLLGKGIFNMKGGLVCSQKGPCLMLGFWVQKLWGVISLSRKASF